MDNVQSGCTLRAESSLIFLENIGKRKKSRKIKGDSAHRVGGMASWPYKSSIHQSCWPVKQALILEQTAKSSPVYLRFCLFEKYSSLIEHYTRISLNTFSNVLTGQKRRLPGAKISLANHHVQPPFKNYFKPWPFEYTIMLDTCNYQ